ncbi:dihydroneopterin aldolase [Frankia sp. AgKG'84/4]|uniref:dihydroneopterin aldolase n=1 Tax=Frankia sp. AgKG'84/4 TaxID=573490 RepID=UPI00200D7DAD|nr:dihydroneopterin aldolase [Frankia sp. AgKG'84/4]MCL9798124.1 dihydroneopterin aldolase [Frankia sp. AgKG'84/4]
MTRAGTPLPGAETAAAAGSDDHITLTGLRVRGRHGVLPAERELGQEFVVDAVIWLDMTRAAQGDDVTLTVHYGELAETLAGIVGGEPVDLIETLAYRLADACLAHGTVTRARITVHKPAAPIPLAFTDVAVTVTRDQPSPVPAAGPGDGR